MLINYCKKNDSLEGCVASQHTQAESLVLGKLARHLCLQSTLLVICLCFIEVFCHTSAYGMPEHLVQIKGKTHLYLYHNVVSKLTFPNYFNVFGR